MKKKIKIIFILELIAKALKSNNGETAFNSNQVCFLYSIIEDMFKNLNIKTLLL